MRRDAIMRHDAICVICEQISVKENCISLCSYNRLDYVFWWFTLSPIGELIIQDGVGGHLCFQLFLLFL